MKKDPIQQIEELAKQTNDYLGQRTQSVLGKYPIIFSLLTIFGLVSIVYGFESFISRIPILGERPLAVFLLGIIILIFTGTLYKTLDRKIDRDNFL